MWRVGLSLLQNEHHFFSPTVLPCRSWLYPLFQTSDAELIHTAGLDALVSTVPPLSEPLFCRRLILGEGGIGDGVAVSTLNPKFCCLNPKFGCRF